MSSDGDGEVDRLQVPQAAAFSLQLLGRAQIQAADGRVIPLQRNDAALLALLAIEGPTSRARAAQWLWPDAQREQAARNLRQRLFRLRRSVGINLIEGDDTLVLVPELASDMSDLSGQLAASARAAPADPLATLDFGDAGSALADWVDALRDRWRALRSSCLADIAQSLESEGRLAEALDYAERLVADEPSAEHAHRRLMRLHYLRGDRGAALAAFEGCRLALHRELGEPPGEETLELAAMMAEGARLPTAATVGHPAPIPLSLLRPPRLVGREPELQALAAAWRRGLAVLITGEPGIGKSRLVDAWAELDKSVLVLRLSIDDGSAPYAGMARLLRQLVDLDVGFRQFCRTDGAAELRRLLPELGRPPPGDLKATRLQAELEALLGTQTTAPLRGVVVDDLQYADTQSLNAWLALAASRSPALPSWAMAVRAGEQPEPLATWLAGPAADRVLEVPVRALDRDAAAELMSSLSLAALDAKAWADALWRHAGGSPALMLETLRAAMARGELDSRPPEGPLEVPQHVGQLIERRLARLAPGPLRLAQLAALAVSDFSVPLAAKVLGRHALDLVIDWRALEEAHVLRGQQFAHDLVREATLRGVPQPIATELHLQIAAAAEGLGLPPARVADHWLRGGDSAKAAASFDLAARRAHADGKRAEELQLADCAAAAWRSVPDAKAEVAAMLAAARAALTCEAADEFQLRLATLRARVQGQADQLQLDLIEALACIHHGRSADALVPARRAWEATETGALVPAEAGSAGWQVEAGALFGVALAACGRHQEALEVLRIVEVEGRPGVDMNLRAMALSSMGSALWLAGQPRRAAECWTAAALLLQDLGQWSDAIAGWSSVASALAVTADPREGLQAARRAVELHRRQDGDGGTVVSNAHMVHGMLATRAGRFEEAEAALLTALAGLQDPGATSLRVPTESHLGLLYIELGQLARARQHLAPVPSGSAGSLRRLQLIARLEPGRSPARRQALEAALDAWRPHNPVTARWSVELELAMVRATEGDVTSALEVCRRVRQQSHEAAALPPALAASWYEARVLALSGAPDPARRLARQLIEDAGTTVAFDIYAVAFWLELASVLGPDASLQMRVLSRASDWLQLEALPHVPAAYRQGFLQRNPANAGLRAALVRIGSRVPW